ncbi:MAG: J domain-containing protein [Hyphomicrobiales bacterium]
MKLDSKYFDKIRVKPDEDRLLRKEERGCDWPDCDKPGKFPAPRGRESEGEYYHFCVDHVRQYNKSYNYFKGMKEDDVQAFQADARSGHRPTWRMGANASKTGKEKVKKTSTDGYRQSPQFTDTFGLFGENGANPKPEEPRRAVRNAERKALQALSLDANASPEEVKKQYKSLVKRHHPDANGGSRASEDRFREIVQAYDYLKSAGFC